VTEMVHRLYACNSSTSVFLWCAQVVMGWCSGAVAQAAAGGAPLACGNEPDC
jgi:hypothetical protein